MWMKETWTQALHWKRKYSCFSSYSGALCWGWNRLQLTEMCTTCIVADIKGRSECIQKLYPDSSIHEPVLKNSPCLHPLAISDVKQYSSFLLLPLCQYKVWFGKLKEGWASERCIARNKNLLLLSSLWPYYHWSEGTERSSVKKGENRGRHDKDFFKVKTEYGPMMAKWHTCDSNSFPQVLIYKRRSNILLSLQRSAALMACKSM